MMIEFDARATARILRRTTAIATPCSLTRNAAPPPPLGAVSTARGSWSSSRRPRRAAMLTERQPSLGITMCAVTNGRLRSDSFHAWIRDSRHSPRSRIDDVKRPRADIQEPSSTKSVLWRYTERRIAWRMNFIRPAKPTGLPTRRRSSTGNHDAEAE